MKVGRPKLIRSNKLTKWGHQTQGPASEVRRIDPSEIEVKPTIQKTNPRYIHYSKLDRRFK